MYTYTYRVICVYTYIYTHKGRVPAEQLRPEQLHGQRQRGECYYYYYYYYNYYDAHVYGAKHVLCLLKMWIPHHII